jgi:hypothetical protein
MRSASPNNRRFFLAQTLKTTLLAASLAATGSAQNAKPLYYTTTFYHVDDSKRDENLDFTRKVMSKFYAGLVKDVAQVRSVTISEVVYGGNPEPRGNFIVNIVSEGPPHPDPAVTEPIYKSTTGMSGAEFRAKAALVRSRVGQILAVNLAREGSDPLKEGDFIRVDYMKVAEGRNADYLNMERTDYQPLHAQRIKDGNMKRWLLNAMRSPAGEARPYDNYTVQIFSSLDQAMMPARYEELLRKVNPNKSFAGINARMQPTRKIIRGELRRVIWSVSK